MKKIILVSILLLYILTPITAEEYSPGAFIVGFTFGIGTFSAGEDEGGSVFTGGSMSVDWIPGCRIGLFYGLETALLGGKKQDDIIFCIPAIFRLGWQPDFLQFEKINIFLLAKLGWGFGLWGENLEAASTPSGIVCGFNFGAGWVLTSSLRAITEIGYNYYGMARNSNYPEYPLGYGSGKVYASVGLSIKASSKIP